MKTYDLSELLVKYSVGFLVLLISARLFAIFLLPINEPTEARYAEIARFMASSGDWITPWFNETEPFWGKPPFSFWLQAISIKLFGANEFGARLPSLIASLATGYFIYVFAYRAFSKKVALLSLVVFASCLASFISAGAVMTDPFLALAVCHAMVSLYVARLNQSVYWRYGFFVAMAIGLLTKGPIAGVLIMGAVVLWFICNRCQWSSLSQLPWLTGTLLSIALVAPWYILAELKTPGFLQYFVVGEHFLRFVEPGWTGDLYGAGHMRSKGAIWVDGLIGVFPWALIVPYCYLKNRVSNQDTLVEKHELPWAGASGYLAIWLLFPFLFFTMSSNILWTYTLPALPAFSILCAAILSSIASKHSRFTLGIFATLIAAPALIFMVGTVIAMFNHSLLRTDKYTVDTNSTTIPIYTERPSFSARFYLEGRYKVVPLNAPTKDSQTLNPKP